MEPITVQITINKIQENGETYFLATSNDIEGFLAEGDTFEECLQNAEDVANDLIVKEGQLKVKIPHVEIPKRIVSLEYRYRSVLQTGPKK
jgi:predicted RNase H-like HicB family nuclease